MRSIIHAIVTPFIVAYYYVAITGGFKPIALAASWVLLLGIIIGHWVM